MVDPWAFEIEPGVVALLGALAGSYVFAIRRAAPKWAPRPDVPVTRAQAVFFALGVVSMGLALGWPVHPIGERYLFSAHMIQHMVVGYIAAPLLLMGTPGWMLRALLGRGAMLRVARVATRPLLAFAGFNAFIAVIHWPALVDLSLREGLVHSGIHLALVLVSLAVWIPVVSPMPELPRLSTPTNLLYLFGQSILPTVPASFLTFGDGILYDFYAKVPRLWDISAQTDQQVAGIIMKVGGGFLIWSMIAVLFFVWQAEEERRNRPGHLDLGEMELELIAR